MGQIFNDYEIPVGYQGILYSGDVFFFYEGEDLDYPSGASLNEGDANVDEWFEDLDGCIDSFNGIRWENLFDYPRHDYAYARIIIDGIELDGTEESGRTGWDYNRLNESAYLGDIIANPDFTA